LHFAIPRIFCGEIEAVVDAVMTTGKQRVLVVEDNDDTREALAAMLELWNLEVDAVSDGEQALMLARNNSYSAVLVDLSIPEPGGYAVARQLRTPSRAPTLIAVTGRSGTMAKQMAFDAGFDHFLTKPVDLHHLSQLLKSGGIKTAD
jgi:DNA-binding response OmpR family regulator